MAPSLMLSLKELGKRSRVSFHRFERSNSNDASSEENQSNDSPSTSRSLTPPSSVSQQSDPALHLQLMKDPTNVTEIPIRPHTQSVLLTSIRGNRRPTSVYMSPAIAPGKASPPSRRGSRQANTPLSTPYSPVLSNISDGAWVYQKILLVHGTIGGGSISSIDGTLIVSRFDDALPPTQWPVCDAKFKAVIYMLPGPNRLRLEFTSSSTSGRLSPPNGATPQPPHTTYLTVHMLPPTTSPPLQLAILLAKDSPGTYDATPEAIAREPNNLMSAINKFRIAAYLWQAYTAEQMRRQKLGRRVFRFEEEWVPGTAHQHDVDTGTLRSEARVHVIRTDYTIAELRDVERAQQSEEAQDRDALFSIAAAALKRHFAADDASAAAAGIPLAPRYVSVLLLDSHWDTASRVITGHAALGGAVGPLNLGIFGSHCLQSYPSTLDDVVRAFSDTTPTDTAHVANDCGDAGCAWEAAVLGIGAHLHETGHLFGLPHRPSGVMRRDYVRLHRSFLTREAASSKTRGAAGAPLGTGEGGEECAWHRLDCLHFRTHPCFPLPQDLPRHPDDSLHAWPIDSGSVVITAASGLAYLEILPGGDDQHGCAAWIEYPCDPSLPVQRSVTLTEQELRSQLAAAVDATTAVVTSKSPLRIRVRSHAGGTLDIADFGQLSNSKDAALKIGNGLSHALMGKTAFRSMKVGKGEMADSAAQELVFASATPSPAGKRALMRVVAYHGRALDGLEFVYDNGSMQMFGKKGGKPGGDVFELDIRRGECITGFHVRSGLWVDAIQILTSLGRRSPVYGNARGGSAHTFIPPRGYNICGVHGSVGTWVDSFGAIITR